MDLSGVKRIIVVWSKTTNSNGDSETAEMEPRGEHPVDGPAKRVSWSTIPSVRQTLGTTEKRSNR